jgi:hypothetical protein
MNQLRGEDKCRKGRNGSFLNHTPNEVPPSLGDMRTSLSASLGSAYVEC